MTDRAPTPLTDEEIADAIRDGESILASGNRGAWAFSVELTVAGMRELQASRARRRGSPTAGDAAMTREPAPVRVGDELAFEVFSAGFAAHVGPDVTPADHTAEQHWRDHLSEGDRNGWRGVAVLLADARAALAAMRSTPVGKLMADRDELTQDVQRLMRERDGLREALEAAREAIFWRLPWPEYYQVAGALIIEKIDAALAVHGQRGGGENDAASGDADAEVEQAKSGVAPVALPNDAADSPAQAATPPPPAPSRAELLARHIAMEVANQFGGSYVELGDGDEAAADEWCARVLAAWEARDDR